MSRYKQILFIVVIVILVIFLAVLAWFVVDLRNLNRAGRLRPTRGFHRNYLSRQILSPTQIQDWMTFSYINFTFNLPPNYLSGKLAITDSRYPNLGINQYTKTQKLNAADFLVKVQDAVSQYTKIAPTP